MQNKKIYYILGIIILIVSILAITYKYIDGKIDIAYDMINLELNNESDNKEDKKVDSTNSTESDDTTNETTEEEEEVKYNYIGYLEIPRIDLYRGFLNKDSEFNDISVNVEIHQKSSMPGVSGGNVIFSAHSGTNYNAYFKDLHKLENGDKIYIYYDNYKYTYVIDDIYNVPKVGKASIYRDKSKNTLTLITCTYNDESAQTIYIAYEEKKEKY